MTRVLFVDDEANVRDALARQLRPWRHTLEAEFVDGGEAALARLAATPFDAIVSDIRMPGMDGIELLTRVKTAHPEVVRIVLSGHVDSEANLKLVPVAHQVLSKPCDPPVLREVISRLGGIRLLLENQKVREIVGELSTLPTLPQTYFELNRALSDPDARSSAIAALIEQDVGMTAKVLQLVNSAFFSLRRKIVHVHDGVVLMGTDVLRSIVLAAEIFRGFERLEKHGGFSLAGFQRHALLTASIARRLMPNPDRAAEAFTSALLHDLGKLVLASRLTTTYSQLLGDAARARRPIHAIELDTLGITHAEVGAYMLGVWGLPTSVVEVVAYHHHPRQAAEPGFGMVMAVHVANALAHEAEGGSLSSRLDLAYLEELGMDARLDRWRDMASTQAAQLRGPTALDA